MLRGLPMLRLLNLGSLITVIIVNVLAVMLPINGVTTGEVSHAVPTLVTPVDFTFSIWGLIYLLLIAFAVNQALPSQANNTHINRIEWWFIIANAANIAWLLLWHHWQFELTLIPMFILLGSLITIYVRLETGIKPVTRRNFVLVSVPFSLYLGWICISVVANVAVALVEAGWGGFGIDPRQWAAGIGLMVMFLALVLVITRRDFVFAGVVVWAFIGIWFNHDNTTWLAYTIAAYAIITTFVTGLMLVNMVIWESAESALVIIKDEK